MSKEAIKQVKIEAHNQKRRDGKRVAMGTPTLHLPDEAEVVTKIKKSCCM